MTHAVLTSGHNIPIVGLGTWRAEPTVVGSAVISALSLGYRHIDCAALYGNEKEIGAALQTSYASGVVKRGDVFLTSKVWNDQHGQAEVVAACRQSLAYLETDYLDLYLVHFPVVGAKGCNATATGNSRFTAAEQDTVSPTIEETWAGMQDVLRLGLARSIGVSNFSILKIERILAMGGAPPVVNQVEAHVGWRQDALLEYCKAKGIHVTAYCPLGRPDAVLPAGVVAPLEDPIVLAVAARVKRSPAQVLLRWGTMRGMSVIPKSTNPLRLSENTECLAWDLSDSDLEELRGVKQRRIVVGQFFVGPKFAHKTYEELWDVVPSH